jgi:Fe2+ or Zn2+ uptake regulation protein
MDNRRNTPRTRSTEAKRRLEAALSELDGPFTARELRLRSAFEGRPDIATVYRYLREGVREGRIRELPLAGESRFERVRAEEHPHFRCLRCGRCDCLDLPGLRELLAYSGRASGRVERVSVLLEGICDDCAALGPDRDEGIGGTEGAAPRGRKRRNGETNTDEGAEGR